MERSIIIFYLAIAVLIISFSAGCSKQEDNESPVIVVAQPSAGTIYENGDTIRFEAAFSDNVQLADVELILVDADNKPMLSNLSRVPGKNPYTMKGDYIIDDPMLPGGQYQLRFRASDGTNVTNRFVAVQVRELQQIMLYPVVVTEPEAATWQVYRLNAKQVWQGIHTHSGDYCGSAVNSAAAQMYICGTYQSDLTAIRLPDGIPLWHVKPGFNQTQRWFEGITFSYPQLYASCTEGNIRAYDKTGNEIYKSETFADATPRHSAVTNNFVISYFRDAFSNNRFLVTFHNPGGKMIYNTFMQADVAAMANVVGEKVLVFSNASGQGDISLFNGTENTLISMHPFYEGSFSEVAKMDSENYLVSGSSGIFWYQLSLNSLTPFVPGMQNAHIACDPTTQQVYACSGKTMNVYSFPFAALAGSIPLPDTAVDFHLVFNK